MGRLIAAAVILALIAPVTAASPVCALELCCKRCSAGKPCGNSCIAKTAKCTKPKGCACQG